MERLLLSLTPCPLLGVAVEVPSSVEVVVVESESVAPVPPAILVVVVNELVLCGAGKRDVMSANAKVALGLSQQLLLSPQQ
jgi:hypothetical protein